MNTDGIIYNLRQYMIGTMLSSGIDRDLAGDIAARVCDVVVRDYGGSSQWIPKRRQLDDAKIRAARAQGQTLRKIAQAHGVSHVTVIRHLAETDEWCL